MSRHTPGPWIIHGGPGRLKYNLAVIDSIPDVDGRVIANCICTLANSNDDCDANAKLIAAAPELLEALVNMVAIFEMDFESNLPGTDSYTAISFAKEIIRNATISD